MFLEQEHIERLSQGAQVLGGGGGGREARGLKTAREAMEVGQVRLAALEELSPDDLVVTVSGVGAPSQSQAMYTAEHYLRALELLEQRLDRPIAGFIPSEMGGERRLWSFPGCSGQGHPGG